MQGFKLLRKLSFLTKYSCADYSKNISLIIEAVLTEGLLMETVFRIWKHLQWHERIYFLKVHHHVVGQFRLVVLNDDIKFIYITGQLSVDILNCFYQVL